MVEQMFMPHKSKHVIEVNFASNFLLDLGGDFKMAQHNLNGPNSIFFENHDFQ